MAELENIADNILEEADNFILEQIPEVVKEDTESLYIATKVFLKNIDLIYTKIQNFNIYQKSAHKLRELASGKKKFSQSQISSFKKDLEIYKGYQIADKEFEIFYSQIEQYQKALNQYLGKTIKTIFLYQDKNGAVEIYELVGDLSKAITKDIASRGGGLSARFSASKINDSSVFQKYKTALDSENVTKTYTEVLLRGQESRKYLKKRGMLVFWQPTGVWKKMYVAGGAGDIGEAYLSFMFSEERMRMFHGSMEQDIDVFMIDGVALVNNISGLLKGDFSVDDTEYAAKAENASVMGYKQIMNIANNINKNPDKVADIMNKEYNKILRKEKSGKGRRNKLIECLDKTLIDEIEPLQDFTKNRMEINYSI